MRNMLSAVNFPHPSIRSPRQSSVSRPSAGSSGALRGRASRLAWTLSLVSVITASMPAHAQATDEATTKAARARFQEGVSLYDKGQFEASRAAFLQAYALRKHPAVLLNLAQSSLRSGRPYEAAKYFQQYLREASTATPAQHADAEKGLAEARTKIGRFDVSAPSGAEISVDGTAVGVAPLSDSVDVEPGTHSVRARMTDGTTETKSASARAGERVAVQLSAPIKEVAAPVPVPSTPPSNATETNEPERPQSTTFDVQPSNKSFWPKSMAPVYIGAGMVVVGVGSAIVFNAFKQSALDSAKNTAGLILANNGTSSTCNAPSSRFAAACKSLQDDVDRSNTDNTIANVGIGVGIAGAVLGLVWLFAGPKRDAESPPLGSWQRPLVTPMLGDARGLKLQATF